MKNFFESVKKAVTEVFDETKKGVVDLNEHMPTFECKGWYMLIFVLIAFIIYAYASVKNFITECIEYIRMKLAKKNQKNE